MQLAEQERAALFIDGVHLYLATRTLGFDIDFRRLLLLFRRRLRLIRALYYTLEPVDSSSLRPLVDWLSYNGFCVVTKPARAAQDGRGGQPSKGDMGVELAVDALRLAAALDHIVLVAGHADYGALVAGLQGMGKRVSVLSSTCGSPPMVSDDLRRQADQFIDLADLRPILERSPAVPPRTVVVD